MPNRIKKDDVVIAPEKMWVKPFVKTQAMKEDARAKKGK